MQTNCKQCYCKYFLVTSSHHPSPLSNMKFISPDYGYGYLGYEDYRGSYADDYYGCDYGYDYSYYYDYYEDDYGYGGSYRSPVPRGRGSFGGPPPPPPSCFCAKTQVTWDCNLNTGYPWLGKVLHFVLSESTYIHTLCTHIPVFC